MQIQGLWQQGASLNVENTKSTAAMREGEVLSGHVVAVEDGTATLRLENGAMLRAQVESGVPMQPGQRVSLTVASVGEDKIVMRLSGEANAQGENITVGAGPASDPHTAQVFQFMRQYRVAPTKENFARVQTLLDHFPELDNQTAVFIAANARVIPGEAPTSNLRALVDALMNPAQGPAQSLEIIAANNTIPAEAAVPAETTAPTAPASPTDAALPAGPAAQTSAPAATAVPAQTGGITSDAVTSETPVTGSAASEASGAATQTAATRPSPLSEAALVGYLAKAAPEGLKYLSATGRLADVAAALRASAGIPAEAADTATRLFSLLTGQTSEGAPPVPADLLPAIERAAEAFAGNAPVQDAAVFGSPAQAPLPPEVSAGFQQQILNWFSAQQTPQTDGIAPPAAQAGTPEAPPESTPQQRPAISPETLSELTQRPQGQEAFVRADGSGAQAARDAASAAGRTLTDIAQSLFARLPAQGEAGAEVRRAAEALLSGLGALREETALGARSEVAAAAYQADARAQALPQITQFYYMQLPVQLFEKRQDAELYVMKRPRRQREEGEEYTILIALETENIGRVETVLRAQDKSVSIQFRMTPGGGAEAVRGALPELTEAVEQAGYSLREAIVAALQEPVTPKNFERLVNTPDGRQSLDIKI